MGYKSQTRKSVNDMKVHVYGLTPNHPSTCSDVSPLSEHAVCTNDVMLVEYALLQRFYISLGVYPDDIEYFIGSDGHVHAQVERDILSDPLQSAPR